MSRHTADTDQRAADSLQNFLMFIPLSQPDPSDVLTECLDFHANENIIILKLALSE